MVVDADVGPRASAVAATHARDATPCMTARNGGRYWLIETERALGRLNAADPDLLDVACACKSNSTDDTLDLHSICHRRARTATFVHRASAKVSAGAEHNRRHHDRH